MADTSSEVRLEHFQSTYSVLETLCSVPTKTSAAKIIPDEVQNGFSFAVAGLDLMET